MHTHTRTKDIFLTNKYIPPNFNYNVSFIVRFQRGDCGVQEHKIHSLGRRRTGQDQTPLETLLCEHTGMCVSPSHVLACCHLTFFPKATRQNQEWRLTLSASNF